MKITLSVHGSPPWTASLAALASSASVGYTAISNGVLHADVLQMAIVTIYGQYLAYVAGSRN